MTEFQHRSAPAPAPAAGPRISVVVPAHDAEVVLARCLDALSRSETAPHEVLVVDDGSRDRTAAVARERGATVLATPSRSGPGAARNLGVERATGDVVLFVDADVLVRPDTVGRVAGHFARGGVAALFGSYDDDPEVRTLVSQYKNLQHHWVHQEGAGEASTFWAGCGAVRRDVFLESGGFDVARFPRPSIEDIELGYRLRDRGLRIVLDPALQVKHLKRWTLGGLLRTDVRDRALPWSTLILERGGAPRDLNVRASERAAAVLAWVALGCGAAAVLDPRALWGLAAAVAGLVALNHRFYGFLAGRRGAVFAVAAVPLHALYYLYGSAAFVAAWIVFRFRRRETALSGG